MLKLKTKVNEIIELRDRSSGKLLGTIKRLPPRDSDNEVAFGFDFTPDINIIRKKFGLEAGNVNQR